MPEEREKLKEGLLNRKYLRLAGFENPQTLQVAQVGFPLQEVLKLLFQSLVIALFRYTHENILNVISH